MSNATALLNQFLKNINWVGFVCGISASQRTTVRVPNVHEFPGHIACDSASQSEIVIPIMKHGELFGVLDVESPEFDRFDELDQLYLESFVDQLFNMTEAAKTFL